MPLVLVEDLEEDLDVVVLNALLEKRQTLVRGMCLNALLVVLENIFLVTIAYLVLRESTNLIQDKLAVIRVVVAHILVVVPKVVPIVESVNILEKVPVLVILVMPEHMLILVKVVLVRPVLPENIQAKGHRPVLNVVLGITNHNQANPVV